MGPADGAFERSRFFQFVNTYNQGRPGVREISGTHSRALLDSYPETHSLAEVSVRRGRDPPMRRLRVELPTS